MGEWLLTYILGKKCLTVMQSLGEGVCKEVGTDDMGGEAGQPGEPPVTRNKDHRMIFNQHGEVQLRSLYDCS